MTSSTIQAYQGCPSLHINGRPVAAVSAFVKPEHVARFREAGVELYTSLFWLEWWVGPDQYDFGEFDRQLEAYCAAIPDGYLMPRIDLATAGYPWWGQAHAEDMVVMRSIATGEVLDPSESDPRGEEHLHHGVHLKKLNLHSFHSLKWRADAGRAMAALVRHAEAQPYGERIFAWMICDGWPQEWFHWGEYLLSGLEDYAPVAQVDFRRWLRETYANDERALQAAWGRPVHFEDAAIPEPWERVNPRQGEFFDPLLDRAVVDYTACMSDSIVDSIVAVCQAVKEALAEPKITCVFYGYPFCHLPRPQLLGHNALARLLASDAVDSIASPHSYDNRGYGGYHSPQAMADTARRAGKLHFDEVDCKTIWTPKTRWKDNISEPPDAWSSLEMMKKDIAYQSASASASWWCDLFNQGWYDQPECVEPIRRMRAIEEQLLHLGRSSFGEVALVVSERSQLFQAPKDGLIDMSREIFRNWHLSRMGAPFEQLLLSDLARPDIPHYKLYIMADLYYLSDAERELIRRSVAREGTTVLWIYAPGYLGEGALSLENMRAVTGIGFGQAACFDELNVRVTHFDHPLTAGLPEDCRYGSGVDRDQYAGFQKAQYLPDTRVSPAFYVEDPQALVLGTAESTGRPGLAVKEMGGWRSVYSAAPLLSWQLLRNLARWAGVHLYSQQGDMVWGNDRFLSIYAQSEGTHAIAFPRALDVVDAYAETRLGHKVARLDLAMQRFETRLLFME